MVETGAGGDARRPGLPRRARGELPGLGVLVCGMGFIAPAPPRLQRVFTALNGAGALKDSEEGRDPAQSTR